MHNILIAVDSQQIDTDGGTNEFTLVTEGKYYEKAGYKYLTYKETELTGMEGTTTLLKIGGGEVTVIRMGSIEAKQVFALGKKHNFSYVTPYGTFELAVVPSVVENQVLEGEGYLRLEYDLEMDDLPFSRNILSIKVELCKKAK